MLYNNYSWYPKWYILKVEVPEIVLILNGSHNSMYKDNFNEILGFYAFFFFFFFFFFLVILKKKNVMKTTFLLLFKKSFYNKTCWHINELCKTWTKIVIDVQLYIVLQVALLADIEHSCSQHYWSTVMLKVIS